MITRIMMNQMDKKNALAYEAPSVELYEFVVEQGFCISDSTIEEIGDRNAELEW